MRTDRILPSQSHYARNLVPTSHRIGNLIAAEHLAPSRQNPFSTVSVSCCRYRRRNGEAEFPQIRYATVAPFGAIPGPTVTSSHELGVTYNPTGERLKGFQPMPDQLSILTETFSQAAKLPMTAPENRAALRSLALACVLSLDSMTA